MRHYFATIDERVGEAVHNHSFILQVADNQTTEGAANQVWLDWYGKQDEVDYFDESKNSYWQYDNVIERIHVVDLLPAHEVRILQKYLSTVHAECMETVIK